MLEKVININIMFAMMMMSARCPDLYSVEREHTAGERKSPDSGVLGSRSPKTNNPISDDEI